MVGVVCLCLIIHHGGLAQPGASVYLQRAECSHHKWLSKLGWDLVIWFSPACISKKLFIPAAVCLRVSTTGSVQLSYALLLASYALRVKFSVDSISLGAHHWRLAVSPAGPGAHDQGRGQGSGQPAGRSAGAWPWCAYRRMKPRGERSRSGPPWFFKWITFTP